MKSQFLTATAILTACCFVLLSGFIGLRPGPSTVVADEKRISDQAYSNVSDFSPHVDRAGNISLPRSYKQSWSHLGSWAVAKKPGVAVHEIHNVYTQPTTITAFQKTGEFPDGAVLVKEVRSSKSDRLTTGHSAWSTDIKIWFVMVKDHADRFPESEHWGDGWGWALFEAKAPKKNVSAGYDTSCIACHGPAEDSDWVYTYAYPGLTKSE